MSVYEALQLTFSFAGLIISILMFVVTLIIFKDKK